MANRERALEAAVAAVRAAARVCRDVQQDLVTAQTLEKKDKSPVSVADFASQAIVCALLTGALPGEPIVGEEDAHELREAGQEAIRASVVEHVSRVLGPTDAGDVLAAIDLGNAEASGARYWALDPIDGTKGFLRGEQYAIALALIEEGQVVAGVLGCPNLPLDSFDSGAGALFATSRGRGARVYPLWAEGPGRPVHVAAVASPAEARFCESVESGHSNQEQAARIAARLGIQSEPFRIDSQCKYAAVARGDASIYLRMPTRADYREKIWDHAAGMIVVEEAGGRVSDVSGKPLDFGRGRTLDGNRGIIATSGAIHDQVVEAVSEVLAQAS
jgi:HAL2 family 3'(2'),5'-bisphosphate nucleotidase